MIAVLKWFFITLGVIFFGLILGGVYLVVADPFELRPLWDLWRGGVPSVERTLEVPSTPEAPEIESEIESSSAGAATDSVTTDDAYSVTPEANSLLTPAQSAALEFVGIDPATLPTTITPEQEECFISVLGADRVAAIKAGAVPSPLEIFAARECL